MAAVGAFRGACLLGVSRTGLCTSLLCRSPPPTDWQSVHTNWISDSLSYSGDIVEYPFVLSHHDGPRSERFGQPNQFRGAMGDGRRCKGA